MTLSEGQPVPHIHELQDEIPEGLLIARDLFGNQTSVTEKVSSAFGMYLDHIRKLGKVDRIITIISPDIKDTLHIVGVFKEGMTHGDETVNFTRTSENLRWTLADIRDVCMSHVPLDNLESYLGMIHSSLKRRNDLKVTSYQIGRETLSD